AVDGALRLRWRKISTQTDEFPVRDFRAASRSSDLVIGAGGPGRRCTLVSSDCASQGLDSGAPGCLGDAKSADHAWPKSINSALHLGRRCSHTFYARSFVQLLAGESATDMLECLL